MVNISMFGFTWKVSLLHTGNYSGEHEVRMLKPVTANAVESMATVQGLGSVKNLLVQVYDDDIRSMFMNKQF